MNEDPNESMERFQKSMEDLNETMLIIAKIKGGSNMVQLAELVEASIMGVGDRISDPLYQPKRTQLEILQNHGLEVADALRDVGIFMRRQGYEEAMAKSRANKMTKQMEDFLKQLNDNFGTNSKGI